MGQDKPGDKGGAIATSTPTAPRRRMRPPFEARELTPAPTDRDPAVQAEFLLGLIDTLGEEATPEAKRIRAELLGLIETFAAAKAQGGGDEAIGAALTAKLAEVESTLAQTFHRTLKKLRDTLAADSRRLGTKSAEGMATRHMAEGLTLLVAAIEVLRDATDDARRAEAYAMIERARHEMEQMGVP